MQRRFSKRSSINFGPTRKAWEPYNHGVIACFVNVFFCIVFVDYGRFLPPSPPSYFLSNKEKKDQTQEK